MKKPFHAIPDELQGTFGCIMADPPTRFETFSAAGEAKSPQAQYDTMTIDEIKALPVYDLAAKDCVLFFWSVWPLMPHWNDMIEAWGFTYKGLAWEWFKYNEDTEKFRFGPGYGTRKNLEPCLLATRGSPKRKSRSERDFIIEQCDPDVIFAAGREHSRKPYDQYEKIEALFDGPYIELFGRGQQRENWAVWGNEA